MDPAETRKRVTTIHEGLDGVAYADVLEILSQALATSIWTHSPAEHRQFSNTLVHERVKQLFEVMKRNSERTSAKSS